MEIDKIISPIEVSDGAGVKLKRSIGINPNYFDPFLMLDEFGSDNKNDYIGGFPAHPHRGIETVTYMLEGEFDHEDSTGGKGRMKSGDVQWMKTGSGIIHSEMPAMKDGRLHGFQLWINMPAKLKMNKPEYLYLDSKKIGFYKDNEKIVKVIAGSYKNTIGAIQNHNIDPLYFHIELKKNNNFNHLISQNYNSFIYLIEGELKIGEKKHKKIENSTLVLLGNSGQLNVKAIKNSKFLLISGKPINEKIARGGPFVMNTKKEIETAVEEYQNGTFVK